MEFKIGQLRHRITIENLVLESDDQGGQVESWVEFKKVWAKIENKPAYEERVGDRIQAPNKFLITIRYLKGLKEDMRVNFKDRIFQIKSIDAIDERLFFMTFEVEENKAGT